jgi:hypothetical protein
MKNPRINKWTQEMRRKVYGRLVKEIGRHQDWDGKIRPLLKRRQYNQILSELALEFGGAPSAIQQQINFATMTKEPTDDTSLIKNWTLNKSAAQEVGFISN